MRYLSSWRPQSAALLVGLALCLGVMAGCPEVPTGPADNTNDNTNTNTNTNDNGSGAPLPDELPVTIEGEGQVEQSRSGILVTLVAIPDAGWRFQSWFGTVVSNANPLTFEPSDDTVVGVRFVPDLSQRDTDGDGVTDDVDECPQTPAGEAVDADGCGASQRDTDGDGVTDDVDTCPETAPGAEDVNEAGCAPAERDTDGDGVNDDVDECPGTRDVDNVDDVGCAPSQLDDDNDGVTNDVDACPNTGADVVVDEVGCERCGNERVDPGEECDPPDGTTCDDECGIIRPENNDCADATVLEDQAVPGSETRRVEVSLSNERATTDGPVESGACAALQKDVWFCYTASCTGFLTVSLCESDLDTVLALYDGCECPPTNNPACDDDGCGGDGSPSQIADVRVEAGDEFLIRIGGWNGVEGTATLTVTCDPGECTTNADCNDGQFCNGVEQCVDRECQSGPPVDCGDGIACTVDTCDEANDACLNTPDDGGCSDGDFCNGAEVCAPGDPEADADGCIAGVEPCLPEPAEFCNEVTDTCDDCAADTDCDDEATCTEDTCEGGLCIYAPIGGFCDDGLFCTGEEACDPMAEGADADTGCVAGSDPCDDGVGCTDDFCDEDTDSCLNEPVDAVCDDGQFCNGAETCAPEDPGAGADGCLAGTVVDCDDGVDCTVDSCNEDIDACDNEADDAFCDNGLFCDGAESCDPIDGCMAGSDPCSLDEVCNENADRCDECQLAGDCDDLIACTTDMCVEGQCVNEPDDGVCDDGEFCNGAEACAPGDPEADANGCIAGDDPCDDGIGCTTDECFEVNESCQHTPDDQFCRDDGLFCTGEEFCSPEVGCTSTGNPCGAGAICDEETDTCDLQPTTWSSTQRLAGSVTGFDTPETYDLAAGGALTTATVDVDVAALEDGGAVATVLNETIVPRTLTDIYETLLEVEQGGQVVFSEEKLVSMTINTFTLAIASGQATWTFNLTVTERTETEGFGDVTVTTRTTTFDGTQTGAVQDDAIVWQSVDGTQEICTNGECGQPTALSWPLGTWTLE